MGFAYPFLLFLGLGICICLALVFRFLQKRRQAALEQFAARQLVGRLTCNISNGKRRYKNILILLAVFACFTAMARPQYGFKWVDVKRQGIDLLFALDTSKSMLTEDIKPNRLLRARLAILDFVHQLEGDRVGLMPFAGSAYLLCPLTLDYNALEHSLLAVTTDIIPRGGTNIAAVIDRALSVLNNATNHKILIILTDGENLTGDAVRAATEGAKKGLTIYTVGVGTKQGELIPLSEKDDGGGFVKDKKGKFVTSRLDETTLVNIAGKTDGLYVPLGAAGNGLEEIYRQKLSLIPKEELTERRHKVPVERFEWPLAAALILLILEFLIGERKTVRRPFAIKKIRRSISRGGKGAALILFLAASFSGRVYGSEGEEAFVRGNYLQAGKYYKEKLEKSPNDPLLLYNYGTTAFKNNMYDDAIEAFTKTLKSDNVDLQEKAYYNKGNSHYQKGAEMRQADAKATVEQWQQALVSLQSALELSPNDAAAKHNHKLIKQRLEMLQEQIKQQEKEQSKDNDKKQQEQQDKKTAAQQQGQNDTSKANPNKNESTPEQSKDGKQRDREQPNGQQPLRDKAEKTGKPDQSITAKDSIKKGGEVKDRAIEDTIRQQLGKMTKEEAERLLNTLKNEEGELNFIPSDQNNDNNVDRDW